MGRLVKRHQKKSDGASLLGEIACPDRPMTKKPAQCGCAEASRIIHHIQSEYPRNAHRFFLASSQHIGSGFRKGAQIVHCALLVSSAHNKRSTAGRNING